MTTKEQYISFCESHPEIPLFQQAWWMNIVAGSNLWDVHLLHDEHDNIIAFHPFMYVRKYCFNLVLQPNLSQRNGLWLAPGTDKESIHKKLMQETDQLNLDWFLQFFDNDKTCYCWEQKGYHITPRRTFVVTDLEQETQSLFKRIDSSQQRQIRKAERNELCVVETTDAEEFYHFHSECLQLRGEKNFNPHDIEVTLCNEAIRRKQGTILQVKNKTGECLAALLLVWDQTTAYFLIPTYHPQYKLTGASSLLVWHALQYARQKGLNRFDFEGGMQASIARFYKQFGSEPIVYYQVEKVNSLWIRLWKKAKTII